MSMIDFLLTQEVLVLPFVRQGAGVPVYGDPIPRKCRIQFNKAGKPVLKNFDGYVEEQPLGGKLFCTGDYIPVNSKLIFADHEYIVTSCSIKFGFTDHHLEVTFA